MPHVPEMPDATEFDPVLWARLLPPERHEAVRRWLEPLPLRAVVAFALRCAKRVEPLIQLQPLFADAYAIGLHIGQLRCSAGRTADALSAVTHAAAAGDATGAAEAAAAACCAASAADEVAVPAAAADADKLRSLALGKHGEPGRPIRWNDTRLGPLWPNGEPKWYTEAVRVAHGLDTTLRMTPDPNAPPDDPLMIAQINEWREAERWDNEGKFKQYRGEYVFFGAGIIFAHGRSLVDLRPIAEAKAAAIGVPPERVVDYFVPGE